MLSSAMRLPVAVARRSAVPMARMASSSAAQLGGIPSALYKNVWRKSNIMYITYIVAGCVVIEVVYGSVTNGIWESRNKGKLYKHIDWSKFKGEDDEEEEE